MSNIHEVLRIATYELCTPKNPCCLTVTTSKGYMIQLPISQKRGAPNIPSTFGHSVGSLALKFFFQISSKVKVTNIQSHFPSDKSDFVSYFLSTKIEVSNFRTHFLSRLPPWLLALSILVGIFLVCVLATILYR